MTKEATGTHLHWYCPECGVVRRCDDVEQGFNQDRTECPECQVPLESLEVYDDDGIAV